MKAQKLGLALGMNLAVACILMQGCNAPFTKKDRSGNSNYSPATPYVETTQTPAAAPVQTPASAPTAVTATTTVTTLPPEPAPVATPVVPAVDAQPSQVAVVKPLPPEGKKPAPAKHPATAAGTPAAPAAGGFVYTVKSGDQLFAISRRYNVKMSAIEKANPGLKPNKIRVGQKITIPGVSAPAPTAVAAAPAKDAKVMQAAAPAPAAAAASTVAPVKTKSSFKPYSGPTKDYKVRSGDSLGKIAYENGISIRALKELNKLSKDNVRVGQTLLVPAAKVEPATKAAPAKAAAPAKKVEPVKDAAAKDAAAKVEPAKDAAPAAPAAEPVKDAAAKVEPAKDAAPAAPAAEPAKETAVPAAPVAAPAPTAGLTYVVKDGDDLVSVAIAWGISPSALMEINDLKAGDPIKPGQVLKLPASARQAVQ